MSKPIWYAETISEDREPHVWITREQAPTGDCGCHRHVVRVNWHPLLLGLELEFYIAEMEHMAKLWEGSCPHE